MANLGDSPQYLMNILSDNMFNSLGGTTPLIMGVFGIAIIIFLSLYFKLDRGAITFIGLMFGGIMLQFVVIPPAIFSALIIIAGVIVAYGFLNAIRQGEG